MQNSAVTYYRKFEDRKPYKASEFSNFRDILFQFLGIIYLSLGADYLWWRWHESINWDAPVLSLSLYIAEILSFIGSILSIINYWSHKDLEKEKPVHYISQIRDLEEGEEDRPIKIDIFIATYNEEKEIVEDTIKAAVKMVYPYHDVVVNICLLDDGRRDGRDPEKENFKELAEKYNIRYFKREDNIGYKAGNMNNAFGQTDGDFIVVLDADTRPFPMFLFNTLGYFRNKKMAWVQTPQWFYDLEEGKTIKEILRSKNSSFANFLAKVLPFGNKKKFGENILGTDPQLFYDIILRRRNAANASFSCGAGSIQRRDALEKLGKKHKKQEIDKLLKKQNLSKWEKEIERTRLELEVPFRPFVHHISEDIFTSLMLHADENKWESYQHPDVECKMLSPQTLEGMVQQNKRYAEGSIDIALSRYNPLWLKGLTIRQRLAYFETLWSYFSPFWLLVFMLYPIVFFFTLVPPLKAFNFDFFLRIVPFLLMNIVVTTIGNWGVSTKRPEQYYQSGFWIKLSALWSLLVTKKRKFNVTKKSIVTTSDVKYVIPHILIVILTLSGIGYNLYLVYINAHPSYSALFANIFWSIFNFYQLSPIIRSAFRKID